MEATMLWVIRGSAAIVRVGMPDIRVVRIL